MAALSGANGLNELLQAARAVGQCERRGRGRSI